MNIARSTVDVAARTWDRSVPTCDDQVVSPQPASPRGGPAPCTMYRVTTGVQASMAPVPSRLVRSGARRGQWYRVQGWCSHPRHAPRGCHCRRRCTLYPVPHGCHCRRRCCRLRCHCPRCALYPVTCGKLHCPRCQSEPRGDRTRLQIGPPALWQCSVPPEQRGGVSRESATKQPSNRARATRA